jgi:2-phosphoglycerate kinase
MDGFDYREYYILHSVDDLVADFRKQHEACWPGVKAVIRAHACGGRPAVIEGWNLYPEWVHKLDLTSVKSIWLIADDEVLEHRVRADEFFYRGASDEAVMIQHYLDRSLRYNRDLKHMVEMLNMPFIEIHPNTSTGDLLQTCLDKLR